MNKNIEQIQNLNKYEDDFLQKLGLPGELYSVTGQTQIPDEIWNRVSEFQKRGGAAGIDQLFKGVEQNRVNCNDLLTKCETAILTEEAEDNQIRSQYGPKWQRLPSASLNMDIKNRINSYKANLETAIKTDSAVEQSMAAMQPKLTMLKCSRDELNQQMPKGAASEISSSPVVTGIQTCMQQITDMRNAREDIMRRMTGHMSEGEINAELFAIFKGEKTKEEVFGKILGEGLQQYNDEVAG